MAENHMKFELELELRNWEGHQQRATFTVTADSLEDAHYAAIKRHGTDITLLNARQLSA
jgi:hypothetical protein